MQVCGPPASNQSPATNIIGNIDEIWEMEAALEQEKEAEEGDRRRAEEEEKTGRIWKSTASVSSGSSSSARYRHTPKTATPSGRTPWAQVLSFRRLQTVA